VWGVGPPSPLPPGRARHLSSERRTHFVTRPSFAVSVTARSWQFIVSSTDDSWPLYMSPLLSSTVTTWPSASNKTLTGTDDDADADDDDAISAAHAAREARAEEAEDGTHGGAGKGGGGRVLLQAVGRVCEFLRDFLQNLQRNRSHHTNLSAARPLGQWCRVSHHCHPRRGSPHRRGAKPQGRRRPSLSPLLPPCCTHPCRHALLSARHLREGRHRGPRLLLWRRCGCGGRRVGGRPFVGDASALAGGGGRGCHHRRPRPRRAAPGARGPRLHPRGGRAGG
jgi:hypothetical protein